MIVFRRNVPLTLKEYCRSGAAGMLIRRMPGDGHHPRTCNDGYSLLEMRPVHQRAVTDPS